MRKIEPLSDDYVKNLTNNAYSIRDLIQLTGIYGIQRDFDFKLAKVFATDDKNQLRVEIKDTPHLVLLIVRINLLKKFIINVEIRKKKDYEVDQPRSHIGRDALDSQVAYARERKYDFIHIHAYGKGNDKDWQGYFIWAKYGFLLTDDKLNRKYMRKLNDAIEAGIIPDLKITELYELIQKKEFLEWWIMNGCEWAGRFRLNDRLCLDILDKACGRR